ncbi:MAG TPA: pilus assembly protein PilM, partial [Candidatus Hydrogenedens sp.]|nr:pilus assembly protein PilM [Candidatus Hydrogenedens sp.]
KCEKGFAPTGNPQIDGKGGDAIGRVLNRLVNEIQRSFSYFRSLPGGGQVTRVYLCGGGCALRNIVPFLQRALGIDVRIAQPLSGIAIGPDAQTIAQHPERSCVVLGLALRNWETTALEVNLIPPRILEMRRRKEQAIYWALSMVTLALIMASVIPVRAAQNKAVKQRIDELRRYVAMYDPEVAQNPTIKSPLMQKLAEAKAEIEILKKKVDALDRGVNSRKFWLDEMALVISARPPRTDKDGIWFSNIETVLIRSPQAGQPAVARRNIPGVTAPPGQPTQLIISGFPGIGSRGLGAGIATGALGMGGRRGGVLGSEGATAPQARGQGPQQPQQFPRANGFRIMGLATSDTVIKNFVENLKKASQTLPEGVVLRCKQVLFSEASVQVVPLETLYNAQSAFQGSGGAGMETFGGQQQKSWKEIWSISGAGMETFGGQQRLGAFTPQSRQATTFSATGQNLFTFTITIQFEIASTAQNINPGGGGAGT